MSEACDDIRGEMLMLDSHQNNDEITYPLVLTWRPAFSALLADQRVYTAFPFNSNGVYADGERVEIACQTIVEPYAHLPLRSFCSIGAHSYSISPMKPGTTIGRFCSLAHAIVMMGDAHPVDRITTSAMTYGAYFPYFAQADYNRQFEIEPFNAFPAPVQIGNDVWIGAEAMLKGGITIGDGAIIGARSIVTKDVPPYSVVAGAPATVRKYRFSEKVIERMRALRWWNYQYFDIPRCWTDPERFLDQLEEKIAGGKLMAANYPQIDVGRALRELDRKLAAADERKTALAEGA